MKTVHRIYKTCLWLGALLSPLFLPLIARASCNSGGCSIDNPLAQGNNTDLLTLLQNILQAAIYLGVPIAVLFMVLVGLKFVTAQGEPGKLKTARENFLYTIIGIAIFFGSTLIADVLINTLHQFGVTVGF